MANGFAGNKALKDKDYKKFCQALNFVCLNLARKIIQDAEGATKFVEINVVEAKDLIQAKKVAFRVANSPLVKTAIFGQNPNWGRIAAVVGAADPHIQHDKLSIYLGGIGVMKNGASRKFSLQKLNKIFGKHKIQIRIKLGLGKIKTKVLTCDLSKEYIRINSKY